MYLDGKPFEITRVDDWNVELMDRSVQNPQPRLEDVYKRQMKHRGFTIPFMKSVPPKMW